MSELPYSYHTFLFPFIWRTSEEQDLSVFKKMLSIGKRWIDTNWQNGENPEGREADIWFQNYQVYQFFTEAANDMVFSTRGDHVVECFTYRPNGKSFSEVNGEFIIEKGTKKYILRINDIQLYVYEVGVALLSFELENYKSCSLAAVNAINEYGRRINLPFLVTDMSHPICADCIQIKFDGAVYAEENYRQTAAKIKQGGIEYLKGHISLSYIMVPIQKILDHDGIDNGGYKVTAHRAHQNKNTLYIKPCIDDRMFVCCLVRDDEFSKKIQQFDENVNEYKIITDCYQKNEEDLSEIIYKLFFIEESCTCHSHTMRCDVLKDALYTRWIDWGTLYGVTHHSIVCLTSTYGGIIASVINPFLSIYVRMAIIMVIQRATILLFEDEAAKIADSFSENHIINTEQLRKIEILQARYVKAQNQLLLSELTVQEQGVELHEMLRRQLYVEKNMADLNGEMNNLRDIADIANERIERRNEQLEEERDEGFQELAYCAACALAFFGFAEPISVPFSECKYAWIWLSVLCLVAGWVIGFIVFKLRKWRKERNRNEYIRIRRR